jgi:hypothetical protein
MIRHPMNDSTLRGALALCALAASLALPCCGARTGLLVPDVATTPDAVVDVVDVTDVTEVPRVRGCVPGRFDLAARAADVLLVLDRSGSMAQGLDGSRTNSKWRQLRDALAATLPRFQDRIDVGAIFYPEDGAETRTAACAFANIPSADVDPAARTAPRVLSVFDATGPGGSTPTAAACGRRASPSACAPRPTVAPSWRTGAATTTRSAARRAAPSAAITPASRTPTATASAAPSARPTPTARRAPPRATSPRAACSASARSTAASDQRARATPSVSPGHPPPSRAPTPASPASASRARREYPSPAAMLYARGHGARQRSPLGGASTRM